MALRDFLYYVQNMFTLFVDWANKNLDLLYKKNALDVDILFIFFALLLAMLFSLVLYRWCRRIIFKLKNLKDEVRLQIELAKNIRTNLIEPIRITIRGWIRLIWVAAITIFWTAVFWALASQYLTQNPKIAYAFNIAVIIVGGLSTVLVIRFWIARMIVARYMQDEER